MGLFSSFSLLLAVLVLLTQDKHWSWTSSSGCSSGGGGLLLAQAHPLSGVPSAVRSLLRRIRLPALLLRQRKALTLPSAEEEEESALAHLQRLREDVSLRLDEAGLLRTQLAKYKAALLAEKREKASERVRHEERLRELQQALQETQRRVDVDLTQALEREREIVVARLQRDFQAEREALTRALEEREAQFTEERAALQRELSSVQEQCSLAVRVAEEAKALLLEKERRCEEMDQKSTLAVRSAEEVQALLAEKDRLRGEASESCAAAVRSAEELRARLAERERLFDEATARHAQTEGTYLKTVEELKGQLQELQKQKQQTPPPPASPLSTEKTHSAETAPERASAAKSESSSSKGNLGAPRRPMSRAPPRRTPPPKSK